MKHGAVLEEAYDQVVTNLCGMPPQMMRDCIKTVMYVQLVKTQLSYARSFQFPASTWDVVRDVGESGEEKTMLDSDGNIQFKLGENGERLWSEDLTEEKNIYSLA